MSAPQWSGLFNWSMRYQDGTTASTFQDRHLNQEDIDWFSEAMAHYMQDFTARMKEIKQSLDSEASEQGEERRGDELPLEEKEALLDELQEIVEHIDHARDLQKIGGLPTLLDLLKSQHPSLRSRSAEVLATCMQNNPPVQDEFFKAGALPALLALLHDPNPTVRTKALLALAGLIRHYPPALREFREQSGIRDLIEALDDEDTRVVRKALQLLGYALRESPNDVMAALDEDQLSKLAKGVVRLVGHEDLDMRERALEVARELARQPAGLAKLREENLGEALQACEMRLDSLPKEDWDQVKEEQQLCQKLRDMLAGTSTDTEPPLQDSNEGRDQPAQPVLLLGH